MHAVHACMLAGHVLLKQSCCWHCEANTSALHMLLSMADVASVGLLVHKHTAVKIFFSWHTWVVHANAPTRVLQTACCLHMFAMALFGLLVVCFFISVPDCLASKEICYQSACCLDLHAQADGALCVSNGPERMEAAVQCLQASYALHMACCSGSRPLPWSLVLIRHTVLFALQVLPVLAVQSA